ACYACRLYRTRPHRCPAVLPSPTLFRSAPGGPVAVVSDRLGFPPEGPDRRPHADWLSAQLRDRHARPARCRLRLPKRRAVRRAREELVHRAAQRAAPDPVHDPYLRQTRARRAVEEGAERVDRVAYPLADQVDLGGGVGGAVDLDRDTLARRGVADDAELAGGDLEAEAAALD